MMHKFSLLSALLCLIATNAQAKPSWSDFLGASPKETALALQPSLTCETRTIDVTIPIITAETEIQMDFERPISGGLLEEKGAIKSPFLKMICTDSRFVRAEFLFHATERSIFQIDIFFLRPGCQTGGFGVCSLEALQGKWYDLSLTEQYPRSVPNFSGIPEEMDEFIERFGDFLLNKNLKRHLVNADCDYYHVNLEKVRLLELNARCHLDAYVSGNVWRSLSLWELYSKGFFFDSHISTIASHELLVHLNQEAAYQEQNRRFWQSMIAKDQQEALENQKLKEGSKALLDSLLDRSTNGEGSLTPP